MWGWLYCGVSIEIHITAPRLRKRRNECRMEYGPRTDETILSPTISRRVRLLDFLYEQDWTKKCGWISRIGGSHPTGTYKPYENDTSIPLQALFFLNSTIICRSICPHVQVMSLAGLEGDLRRQATSSSTEGIFLARYWGTSSRDSTSIMQKMWSSSDQELTLFNNSFWEFVQNCK